MNAVLGPLGACVLGLAWGALAAAQARLSALVVGASPLGYLVFSALVDPASVGLLVRTNTGRLCLGLGLLLEVVAVVWMRRILASAEAE